MPSKPEKWDYIISGRPYGIMRMAIYFYYKICIGPRGFFFKTNPFNGKYYKYTDIERCGEGVIKASRSASSAAPATDRHFFYFTDRSGKKHEALLEYPLYKNEIIILIGRIHSVQTDSFD